VPLFPHLGKLRPYLVRYRRQVAWGYLCVVLQSGSALAVPWLLKRGVDAIQRGAPPSFLLSTALIILGLSAFSSIFLFFKRWVLIGASRLVEYDLRQDFFAHLQRQSLSFFSRHRTGDLMARATNDLNAVRDVIGPGLMYGMTTLTTVAVSLVLMLRIDPVLAAATLVPFPLMAVVVSRFAQEIHRRSVKVQDQYGVLSNAAQETIAGIRIVQGYGQEEAEGAHFAQENRSYLDCSLDLIRFRALFQGSIAFLLGGGSLLLLWIGGMRVIRGGVTLGELVAFTAYLAQLTWPFIAVGWVISLVQRGEAAMQRIQSIRDEVPEIQGGPMALPEPVRGEIRFEGVSFRYGGGTEVLHAIDLVVPAGTVLAVTGRTGSGKSTLLNLLPRLYDPSAGRVLLDGVDLRELDLGGLRRAIGVVPQEPFLFSDTLSENIRFGRADAATEEVLRAAREARLEADLAGFQLGIETRVGERGVTLSGGQRQRTALARALLKDPPVLLLDDPLSSVDKSTEAELLRTIRDVAAGRTVIIVAHRVSTARTADRIVVLDAGRIAESGTHDELISAGGLYAELARRQTLVEELEESDVRG
jgi:ATP-binding cassette, subfamily B, multidrug efflux pump